MKRIAKVFIDLFRSKWTYLALGATTMFIQVALMLECVRGFFPAPTAAFLFEGFNGNVSSSILTGVGFLFIALFLDHSSSQKIDHLWERASEEMEEQARNRRHDNFHYIFNNHYKYDIEILTYKNGKVEHTRCYLTIVPTLDQTGDGKRLTIKQDGSELLVIQVEPIDSADRAQKFGPLFEKFKIKEGEYYYCAFYNGYWAMFDETFGDPMFFTPIGTVLPIRGSVPANEVVKPAVVNWDNFDVVAAFEVDNEGRRLQVQNPSTYKLVKSKDANDHRLWLQIHTSPLKPIIKYLPPNMYQENSAKLDVQGLRGYFSEEAKFRVIEIISGLIQEKQLPMPRALFHAERQFF